jgi:glycosyltransferase involved in cell wall biosynthesis
MRALLLSRYGRLGSSSRVRSFQYLDLLREAEWDVTVSPLLSDGYIERLYAGRRQRLGDIVRGYARRVHALLGAGKYDLVWIESEVFPWIPNILERILLPRHIPYILDFDDAVFHRYDMHPWAAVRRGLGNKVDRLMRDAAVVIAGNEYIRERALAAGARRIEIVPTVVDLSRYSSASVALRALPVIGWIGTPNTQPHLEVVSAALCELSRNHAFKVLLVGADAMALPAVAHETVEWSEDTEVESIRRLDIGIMPLFESPFAKGKCGYKLIQYMACGLPVVASPIGINSKLVEHGKNGYLANAKETWIEALSALLSSSELRTRMGAEGRRRVEERYSLAATGPELLRIMATACTSRHDHPRPIQKVNNLQDQL